MDAELREAVTVTKAAVKALNRQARVCAQLLADLERRLEVLEANPRIARGGIATNGSNRDTQVTAAV